MNTILSYTIAMLPFMVLVLPLHILWRVRLHLRQGRRPNLLREAVMCALILFLGGLAGHTLLPRLTVAQGHLHIGYGGFGGVNLIPFHFVKEIYIQAIEKGDTPYFIINFLGNIGIFAPVGLMLPLLWRLKGKQALTIGAGISLFIELVQLFLPRSTDVDDLILNTVGVILGYGAYLLLQKLFPAFCARCKER